MCGIAGLCSFDPSRRFDPEVLRSMGDAMLHRGPDASGQVLRGPVALVSRRLAIVDLGPEGNQPLEDGDGTAWIVFNGEVYNHRELRAELESLGSRFRTRTDTEVVLHAYRRWGPAALDRFRGMFAFAIWDEREATLFLARDRLGIKPLFLRRDAEGLAFASEVKALLRIPGVRAAVDPRGVADYLFCGYAFGRTTMFSGIEVFPRGHWLRVRDGEVEIRRYWDAPLEPLEPVGDDPLDELYGLLEEGVARELEADVPVGTALSGGLDSTLVSTLAAATRASLPTFAIGYERNTRHFLDHPRRIVGEVVGDDLAYAREAAAALGTDHHAAVLPVDDLLEEIDRMIEHREKPLITLSEYGHRRLSREARRDVTVLLSGQGSDELFGGYYYWWRFRERETTTFFPWSGRTDPSDPAYPVTQTDLFDHLVDRGFAEETGYREAQQADFDAIMRRTLETDFFNALTYLLVETHLQEMLELEDRHSMASSLESRVPFLDHRLVEWVFRQPGDRKIDPRDDKHLLREMIAARVPTFPAAVLARRKSPMPPPFDTASAFGEMASALRRRDLAIERYVGRTALDGFLETFDPSAAIVSARHYVVFMLYCLERWHDRFGG